METSAKTSENVTAVFEEIGESNTIVAISHNRKGAAVLTCT